MFRFGPSIFAVLGTLGLAFAVLAAAADTLVVTGDRVNVRRGPGTNYFVLTQLSRGERVEAVERQGEWVKIRLDEPEEPAWIFGRFVEPAPQDEAEAEPAVQTVAVQPEAAVDEPAAVPEEPQAEGVDKLPPAELNGAPTPTEARLVRLRQAVAELNASVREQIGDDVFLDAESLGGGIIQVTATDAWLSGPRDKQETNLEDLFAALDKADGTGLPMMVRIVDDEGNLFLSKVRH